MPTQKNAMTKGPKNDRSRGHKRRRHVRQDKAAARARPMKVILARPLIFPESLHITPEFLGGVIRAHIEATGSVPFDWGQVWPVPELYESLTESGDKLYGLWFEFDTMVEALAVKSKFESHVDIWTEAEEQSLRRYLEQNEGNACPIHKNGESSEAIYWSYRSQFREGKSIH